MSKGSLSGGAVSAEIVAADEHRDHLTIQLTNEVTLALGLDEDAVAGEGVQLLSSGDAVTLHGHLARGAVNAIGNGAIGAYQSGLIKLSKGQLTRLASTAPYFTLENTTSEDTDGGRESRIIFKGMQSGSELTTLAMIQASHDGTSDDQKGDLIFYTNDGSDGNSPTERMRIESGGNIAITACDITLDYTKTYKFSNGTNFGYNAFYHAAENFTWQSWNGSAVINNLTITAATGYIGIGEVAPETLLELTSTAPYITLHNSTEENGDGGRESRIIFKGEQDGTEETTLAMIQASHDGTSDDEKGDLIFYTNDGSDGNSPTEAMRIDSNQRLGIGIATPSYPLHVVGNSLFTTNMYIGNSAGLFDSLSGSYGIKFRVNDDLRLAISGVDKFVVDSSGNTNVLGLLNRKYTVTTDNTDGVDTYSAAQMFGGLIRRGTGDEITAARIDVTDTAANIVAIISECVVGSGFVFYVSNEDSTHTIQVDGGAGVTMSPNDPSTAIPANSTGAFLVVATNVTASSEAVTVHALGFTTH